MNRTIGLVLAGIAVLALGLFAFYMVDVDQTQEAKLPDVDVEVKGGQAPKFDVETGKVEITKEKATVPVPEVKVEEKQVTVPGIKVTPPPSDNPADKKTQ